MRTAEVAKMLGVPYYRLLYLIRSGRIDKPERSELGDFLWSRDLIATVRRILGKDGRTPRRDAKAVTCAA